MPIARTKAALDYPCLDPEQESRPNLGVYNDENYPKDGTCSYLIKSESVTDATDKAYVRLDTELSSEKKVLEDAGIWNSL